MALRQELAGWSDPQSGTYLLLREGRRLPSPFVSGPAT